ncbi:type II toxin-antitoxin system RelE/ParE family toxin [Falsiroseomonas sp. HW251]|uniref:type II toxin-antitoxin system RelE/ParE family toxin n=1 Tax=Falsiroseomonas sp. HW251 TaxID=3390998 RepID=UPI003D3105DB
MRLVFAPSARRELADALTYVAAENPVAAQKLNSTIQAAIARILAFPSLGPRFGRGQRRVPVGGTPYLIVYRATRETVVILRVWHGARQWPPASS